MGENGDLNVNVLVLAIPDHLPLSTCAIFSCSWSCPSAMEQAWCPVSLAFQCTICLGENQRGAQHLSSQTLIHVQWASRQATSIVLPFNLHFNFASFLSLFCGEVCFVLKGRHEQEFFVSGALINRPLYFVIFYREKQDVHSTNLIYCINPPT